MVPGLIHIAYLHAEERRQDMVAEARYARQVELAERANRPADRTRFLRHQLGATLVSLGQRLQRPAAYPARGQGAPAVEKP